MGDPEKTDPAIPAPAATPAPARRATDLPENSPWWAFWLEANFKEAWKWLSVQFPVAVGVLAEIYAADPAGSQDFVKSIVPAHWWPHLIAAGCMAQVALRLVRQKPPTPKA